MNAEVRTAIITSVHMIVPGHMMTKTRNMLPVVTAELQKVCKFSRNAFLDQEEYLSQTLNV